VASGPMNTEDITHALTSDLILARKRRGWSQRQLAEELGVSYQRVQELERGVRCTVDTLARWAKALDRGVEIVKW